jgi:hypothetical protein
LAGYEPWRIAATSQSDKLLLTSRLDLNRGLRTVQITNDNPLGFKFKLNQVA